jgi:hypothetical protein
MPALKNNLCAALVATAGFFTAIVMANGEKKGSPPTTSTGRELTGPGAHPEEYIVPPGDKPAPRADSVQERAPKGGKGVDSLRGGDTGPTRPEGSTKPSVPRMPSGIPGGGRDNGPLPGEDRRPPVR